MQIITKTQVIAGAPARWAERYPGGSKATALLALAPGFTAEQVNQIIGNDGWTKCECDVCGDDVEAVAVLTPEAYQSERSLNVCLLCLDLAASEISNRGNS